VILLGSEIRFWGGRGRDELIRLAGDAGFEGVALGPWCTRGDALALVAEAAKSGMTVPVAAAPLLERPLAPDKRLPYLGSVDDPEERRAAARLFADTVEAAVPLGVRTFTVAFGDVVLATSPAHMGWWFRRRELDEGEPREEALGRLLAERRARSEAIVDACRSSLDLIVAAAEQFGAVIALELPAGPWGAPSPREASQLLDEYRQAPLGIVWDAARMQVLRRLGAAPSEDRAKTLAAAARVWRANEAVGIEVGFLPGQGDVAPDDPLARLTCPEAAALVITGRADSTLGEVRRARELCKRPVSEEKPE
jgi:sugar phosphate isomerase/epimerase